MIGIVVVWWFRAASIASAAMTTATTTSAATTRSRVDGPRDIRIRVITMAPARKTTPTAMITFATRS